MKKYKNPATEVVATEMRLCQDVQAQSLYGDQGGLQFAPIRRE